MSLLKSQVHGQTLALRIRGEPLEYMYVVYDSMVSALNGTHDDDLSYFISPKDIFRKW